MNRKIALKRLTASDLTFFEWHFRNHNAGNQKAINLNANVFVDKLYPLLPEAAKETKGKLPIDLYIYGPGLANEYNLQRKIVKFGTYKNWRLNGEFVYNPDSSEERFNVLEPGDFVILEFTGDALKPDSVRAIFISKNVSEDVELHSTLTAHLGKRRMASLTETDLTNLINSSDVLSEHPIRDFVLDEALEDAALGGAQGREKLSKRRSGTKVSKEDLQKARNNAEETGQVGEEYVNAYFTALLSSGDIESFEWASSQNAVSPYDFRAKYPNEPELLVEVKSTIGCFNRKVHFSLAELEKMASSTDPYVIYRVFNITEEGAELRIAEDTRAFALDIINAFRYLPNGVISDSVSFSPDLLDFGSSIYLQFPDTEED